MLASKMGGATPAIRRRELRFGLVLLAAVCIYSVSCEQTQSTNGFKESASQDEPLVLGVNRIDESIASPLRANSRILAVPLSLTRFMFPRSRSGGDHQSQGSLVATGGGFGGSSASQNKRSSSQLDALTGVTGLGKRSVPGDYFNLEPSSFFARQNLARLSAARNHPDSNLRWTPVDVMEVPLGSSDY